MQGVKEKAEEVIIAIELENGERLYRGTVRSHETLSYMYGCLLDSYNHYVAELDDRISPAKKRYVLDFKRRVDEIAEVMGEEVRVELPACYHRKDKAETEEQKETSEKI